MKPQHTWTYGTGEQQPEKLFTSAAVGRARGGDRDASEKRLDAKDAARLLRAGRWAGLDELIKNKDEFNVLIMSGK